MPSWIDGTRRGFLAETIGALTTAGLLRGNALAAVDSKPALPLVDYHVHLDNSTIDEVLSLSSERKVKFGIVEHAGGKENIYPVVLSNDQELLSYLAMLEGKGVYRGVQAEWTDWMRGFSREALAKLDYVLTDTMTFPGKKGERVKLWEPAVEDRVEMSDRQKFMDRYVDWHVQIMETEPIDLLANVSWLPEPLAPEHDSFWTEKRMTRVLDAAKRLGVAIEISSSYMLPRLPFLRMAKAAGLKFAFGSNGRFPKMGLLDYSLEMARALNLEESDLFVPAPAGKKAVERRRW